MWSLHEMQYYSVMKTNEALIHASTWMNLENIMWGERRQTQKGACHNFHLYKVTRAGRFIDSESQCVCVGGGVAENNGMGVFLGGDDYSFGTT